MNTFIVTLEKMTIMASVAAIAVMLIRFLLKGAPKKWSYILWLVVLFRCLCPFGIESGLSLYNVFDKQCVCGLLVDDLSSNFAWIEGFELSLKNL